MQSTSRGAGEPRAFTGLTHNSSHTDLPGSPALGQTTGGGGGEGHLQTRPGTSALGLEVLSLLVEGDEDSSVNNVLVRDCFVSVCGGGEDSSVNNVLVRDCLYG